MAIIKRYEDLTIADKIFLLHTLFPQDIKAFLIFLQDRIAWLQEEPERIIIDCDIHEGPSWPDILESLSEHIQQQFDLLADSAFFFIETFSKGKNMYFFLNCIASYRSNHDPFRKAIDFLFDL